MLKIRGETRGEYFHIFCEECGGHIYNEYLGWKTENNNPNGVPHMKSTCKECNTSYVFKLMPCDWKIVKEEEQKSKKGSERIK